MAATRGGLSAPLGERRRYYSIDTLYSIFCRLIAAAAWYVAGGDNGLLMTR